VIQCTINQNSRVLVRIFSLRHSACISFCLWVLCNITFMLQVYMFFNFPNFNSIDVFCMVYYYFMTLQPMHSIWYNCLTTIILQLQTSHLFLLRQTPYRSSHNHLVCVYLYSVLHHPKENAQTLTSSLKLCIISYSLFYVVVKSETLITQPLFFAILWSYCFLFPCNSNSNTSTKIDTTIYT
jgi:hypothetical protein